MLLLHPWQANGADIKGGTWFETGAEMLNGGTLNYFAVPWGIINNPLPLFLIVLIEVRTGTMDMPPLTGISSYSWQHARGCQIRETSSMQCDINCLQQHRHACTRSWF